MELCFTGFSVNPNPGTEHTCLPAGCTAKRMKTTFLLIAVCSFTALNSNLVTTDFIGGFALIALMWC